MCGFFISNSKIVNKSYEQLIESCLRFRGPDYSSGLIEHNGWLAYHSRLAIIDLDPEANQPMIDNKNGMLVFNGEILNYKELGLKYFGIEYRSDTRLLSDLLKEDKLDASELDGFFSFVYIDGDGQLKHAKRDKFGVKPLFFHEADEELAFSSEPNVLKEIFELDTSREAVDEYYSTRAPIFSGSYFRGVSSVSPGHCLIDGEYFNILNYLEQDYREVEPVELDDAIEKGLMSRLVSDAPVGLLLSRGIDSNLLRVKGNFDKFYSIGFSGDEDIEFLKGLSVEGLTIKECSTTEYREAFDHLLNLRKEPMSVPNEVLLYLVSKVAAKDGIKVLLSGEGADEFFGGYDRVFQWALQKDEFVLDEFLDLYCYTKPEHESDLYKKFEAILSKVSLKSPFEKVRWFFIRYHMPVLFRRLDFALMAAGVEGREPIANMHTFLKAVHYQGADLMGQVIGKLPLRDIMVEFMGHDFAYEKKVGFPVDLTKVFDNDEGLTSYQLWFKENLKVLQ